MRPPLRCLLALLGITVIFALLLAASPDAAHAAATIYALLALAVWVRLAHHDHHAERTHREPPNS